MYHLQTSLRYCDDESFNLETRNQFSNRAQRELGQLRELALGKKLAGTDIAGEEVFNKAFLRPFPQLQRFTFPFTLPVSRFHRFISVAVTGY